MPPVTLQELLAEIRNLSYLFYGYTVIWVIILLYVFTLSRREQNLRHEIEELKKTIDEDTPSAPSAESPKGDAERVGASPRSVNGERVQGRG